MKKKSSRTEASPRATRVSVSDAKAKLSQVLRNAERGPIILHDRGRDVAALIGMADYQRWFENPNAEQAAMRPFLDVVVNELQRALGGAALDFERAQISPKARSRRKKR